VQKAVRAEEEKAGKGESSGKERSLAFTLDPVVKYRLAAIAIIEEKNSSGDDN